MKLNLTAGNRERGNLRSGDEGGGEIAVKISYREASNKG